MAVKIVRRWQQDPGTVGRRLRERPNVFDSPLLADRHLAIRLPSRGSKALFRVDDLHDNNSIDNFM
jgi:hypothetical protein